MGKWGGKKKKSPLKPTPPSAIIAKAGEHVIRKETNPPQFFIDIYVSVRVGGIDYTVTRSVEVTGPVRDYLEGRKNAGPITQEELDEAFKGTVKPRVTTSNEASIPDDIRER